jgi:carbamate kinase
MYRPGTQTLVGVEAVIDKDRASCVLAKDLHADTLVIATDTDAVYLDWGTTHQRPIRAAHPDELGPPLVSRRVDGSEGRSRSRLRPDHR